MLELRPDCELCQNSLPPDSDEAFICSYECTFCRSCVDTILQNVCPNCGGGFSPRPVRPKTAFRDACSINHQPASQQRIRSPYSEDQIRDFVAAIKHLPAKER